MIFSGRESMDSNYTVHFNPANPRQHGKAFPEMKMCHQSYVTSIDRLE
jgi:hypothetical protein